MSLDSAAVKFLCAAKSMGVDFSHTMMIGRQRFFPERSSLELVLKVLGLMGELGAIEHSKYSEPFFTLLGAEEVFSLDACPYEGATHLHDLNMPLRPDLSNRFSHVFDGGTLEHVFNVPVAFKNCMEMVRVGGHFTQLTVANNFMGHGFWQMSPELIYRIFAPDNGYRIECVLLCEVAQGGNWYVVEDPRDVGHRIELCNTVPTYILTVAKRMKITEIFAKTPQQSDYVAVWGGDGTENDLSSKLLEKGEEFDERYYLRSNPDVAEAVKNGHFASGKEHFLLCGRSEGRYGTPGYHRIEEEALLRGRIPQN